MSIETIFEAKDKDEAIKATVSLIRSAKGAQLQALLGDQEFREAVSGVLQNLDGQGQKDFEEKLVKASRGRASLIYESGLI